MLNITLLSLIKAIDGIEAEILVVNDCPDRNPVIEKEIASKVLLLNNPKRSVGAARNFGVKNSKGEYIIFLDDDFLISQDSLLGLKTLLDEHPDKIFNAAWIYPPELIEEIKKLKFGRYLIREGFTSLRDRMKGLNWDEVEIFERSRGVSSGILAITRQNFEKTGGYNEEMVFGNDNDFSLRIKAAGLKPFITPTITAYHNERDKISLTHWLTRRKFGIKQLVKHNMVEIPNFPPAKKRLLQFLSKKKKLLTALSFLVPNFMLFDKAYKTIINALFAVYLYEAYNED